MLFIHMLKYLFLEFSLNLVIQLLNYFLTETTQFWKLNLKLSWFWFVAFKRIVQSFGNEDSLRKEIGKISFYLLSWPLLV